MSNDDLERTTLDAFNEIQSAFPGIRMQMRRDPNVAVAMDIKAQSCMAFDMSLYLDGDVLNLTAGKAWFEWFPAEDKRVVGLFVDAVCGLLAGKYRIVETYRGTHCVKTQLQCPAGSEWKTASTSVRGLSLFLPGRRTQKVLQNAGQGAAV